MTSNESENSEGIKELLFDVVEETAELKSPQDGRNCSFLALFEDERQPIHNTPSTKHFNPFINQSSTAIFFIDPDDRYQMTNRNYPYDTIEAYPTITAKNSVDRHLKGVFTAPEQVLLKSNNASSASYKKTSGPHKTHLQDCHEEQHYFIPSEKKEKPVNLEKNGACQYFKYIYSGCYSPFKDVSFYNQRCVCPDRKHHESSECSNLVSNPVI